MLPGSALASDEPIGVHISPCASCAPTGTLCAARRQFLIFQLHPLLPGDVLRRILGLLRTADIAVLFRVSRGWNEALWKHLEGADLSRFNWQINDAAVALVSKRAVALHVMDLGRCWKVTDLGLAHLAHHLHVLNLYGLTNITGAALTKLPHDLRELILGHNHKIEDEDMKHLPPKLQKLVLYNMTRLTHKAVKYAPRTLEHLDLSEDVKITDKVIKHLPRGLKHLNLSACSAITDDELANMPTTISYLNISWCTRITTEGLDLLPKQSLQVMHIHGCGFTADEIAPCLPTVFINPPFPE